MVAVVVVAVVVVVVVILFPNALPGQRLAKLAGKRQRLEDTAAQAQCAYNQSPPPQSTR
ncbi:predicted protein [Plenodomus lingam JN3]|uniref:Predicted protein n=1 Tax=Leptosphaeria maculans (strain JN3 / isolate v23.1.3 / race Av1-4-5-6-7-8) TaxID=985895 RepID=E4ZHS1_LEPMJ|nr:predicted protein [Plenodomus lingam JN3]CBX90904.1 predicted protein [Plenodomus lingam JN3]